MQWPLEGNVFTDEALSPLLLDSLHSPALLSVRISFLPLLVLGGPQDLSQLTSHYKDSQNSEKLLVLTVRGVALRGYGSQSAQGRGTGWLQGSLGTMPSAYSQWGHTDSTQFPQQGHVTLCVHPGCPLEASHTGMAGPREWA